MKTATMWIVLGLLAAGVDGHAADRPLPGKKLVAKSGHRSRLVFTAKGPITTVPAPGTSVDPRSGNASFLIVNPTTRESAVLPLPASGWRGPAATETDPRKVIYKFRNASSTASPVQAALFKPTKGLKLVAGTTGISLDEPSQGSLGLVFRTGVLNYCSLFGGTIKKDVPGKFIAKNAPAPDACPREIPCGNGVVDPGEECDGATGCGAGARCVNCQCIGTGNPSVTLVWGNENDLDLHVIDPNNEEIYYAHRTSVSGGTLDQDANAACNDPTLTPVENVFWAEGTAPSGTYTVLVNFFTQCGDQLDTAFTVHVDVGGVESTFTGTVSTSDPSCGLCGPCACTMVTQFTL